MIAVNDNIGIRELSFLKKETWNENGSIPFFLLKNRGSMIFSFQILEDHPEYTHQKALKLTHQCSLKFHKSCTNFPYLVQKQCPLDFVDLSLIKNAYSEPIQQLISDIQSLPTLLSSRLILVDEYKDFCVTTGLFLKTTLLVLEMPDRP